MAGQVLFIEQERVAHEQLWLGLILGMTFLARGDDQQTGSHLDGRRPTDVFRTAQRHQLEIPLGQFRPVLTNSDGAPRCYLFHANSQVCGMPDKRVVSMPVIFANRPEADYPC